MFARWGRFVYRFRWATLIASALLLGLSIAAIFTGGTLADNGGFGANLLAGKAAKLIADEIHPQGATTKSGSSFTLIFSSPSLAADDPAFQKAVEDAVSPLNSELRVTTVTTPYGVPAAQKAALISKDSHKALVVVGLRDDSRKAQSYISKVVGEVHPGPLSVVATGQVPINQAFNKSLENDLNRAELVALPVTLLLLVLIFASIVAALLPVGVGLLAIAGGVGGTLFLAHFTDVSQYAMNVVTLIGLAVAIDYSLFIVNRFRDELAAGASRDDAIATSMSTAGRAITFSGITVAIGLSAMLFFQGTFMASMGAAGGVVVAIAVLYGLTFLPASLAVLGSLVDWWPGWVKRIIPWLGSRRPAGTGVWHAMAIWVMRRPWFVLVPALIVLLVAGTPFLQLRMATSDVDALPPSNQARQGYDILISEFPGRNETSVEGVVYYPDSSPFTAEHIGSVYDLSRRLAAQPNVIRVQSIFDIDPNLSRPDYQNLYSGPHDALPPPMQEALAIGAGKHVVLLNILTNKPYPSDEARALVRTVRGEHVPDGQVLA